MNTVFNNEILREFKLQCSYELDNNEKVRKGLFRVESYDYFV